MKTELGYEVTGPDEAGELEVNLYPCTRSNWNEEVVYLTHADLVAMLAMFDSAVVKQADEEDDGR